MFSDLSERTRRHGLRLVCCVYDHDGKPLANVNSKEELLAWLDGLDLGVERGLAEGRFERLWAESEEEK